MTNLCNGCSLCCKKYKIYLFPDEAKAIARKLKINYNDFVEKYLDYYIEFYDITNDNFFKIDNKTFFLSLALKQNNGCIFLKNDECSIYLKRPLLCKLFPNYKYYDEEYSFCKLDKNNLLKKENPRVFYPILKQYIEDVKKNGFKKVWKYLPEIKDENIFISNENEKTKSLKNILNLYL